ncbi:MAG: hypothetical protein ACYTCU_07110 [Planctomycetota bacterium]|jgi:hypothetical protein
MNTRRHERGYVLLGSLLMAVLLVSMTMSYSRHVLVSGSSDEALLKVQQAEAAASSGLAWAKQSLLVDGNGTASLSIDGSGSVDIAVSDVGNDTRAITVKTAGDGYDQQVTATAEVFSTTSGELPRLSSIGRSGVSAAGTVINVAADTTYSDAHLTGIVYVRNGVSLTLRDVVLDGTIVTEPALSSDGWTAGQATTIVIDGGLLVDPGVTLPGCAIIAPDASVSATATSGVQLHGVVVADSLSLAGTALLHGQVATSNAPVFSSAVEMPGSGRAPRSWPEAIDTGAQGVGRVYFAKQAPTSGEKTAIKNFAFPAKVSDVSSP